MEIKYPHRGLSRQRKHRNVHEMGKWKATTKFGLQECAGNRHHSVSESKKDKAPT